MGRIEAAAAPARDWRAFVAHAALGAGLLVGMASPISNEAPPTRGWQEWMATYASEAARAVEGMESAQDWVAARLGAEIHKCVADGNTTYSDRPCADAAAVSQLSLARAAAVSIVSSAARVPVPAGSELAPAVRDAACAAAEAELANIDDLTRRGQPADMQAFLEARRRLKRAEQFRHRC